MKINRLAIEAALAGVLLVISILLGLSRAADSASSINANSSVPDTATIDRLTRAYSDAQPMGVRSTTTITGTNGALVAVNLLLGQPYYAVDLPLVTK